ncbi:MAG: GNAT family N-acetyltransferase [Lachnotalea sp.]
MKVEIKGDEYQYFDNIVELSDIRNNFIELINETFGFDFTEWYNEGYWTKKYEPHVLIRDNKVVATVTVNYMKYIYDNKEKIYIQIGGVLTREEYSNKGLSTWLMEQIIHQYQNSCDQMFLLCDDSAISFYPRLGFIKAIEYIAKYQWKGIKEEKIANLEQLFVAKKLDVKILEDRNILLKCYEKSNPISVFTSIECEELLLFYGMGFRKNCVYYFSEIKTVVIAKFEKAVLVIEDIYGEYDCETQCAQNDFMKLIIKTILEMNKRETEACLVEFGFTPSDELTELSVEELVKKDDTLYILDGKENLFDQYQLRFPILSHN